MDLSEIRYATTTDGVTIAYTVIGAGPPDVLMIPDYTTQVEHSWDHPTTRRLFDRTSKFSRLIVMDKRGLGLSDPVPIADMASLELWKEDIDAVLDDLGIDSISIVGQGQGGQMALYFAAASPERARSLVLLNAYAFLGQAEDYPHGFPSSFQERVIEDAATSWGRDARRIIPLVAPSVADRASEFAEWFARVQRYTASPRVGQAMHAISFEIDVRHLAPLVTAPTLILHARDNQYVRAAHGRWLAETMPDARYEEFDSADHWFWVDESVSDAVLDRTEEFFTGTVETGTTDRILATVLFTDVVSSTETAAAMGDSRWRATLDTLDEMVRQHLDRHRGHLVKNTGDGHFATFDGPGRAVRCALALRDAVRPLGLELRTGLHTGEVEMRGEDVSGIAVHIGARVMATAEPGRIFVSGSIPPLVAGSGLEFAERGTHELKGVPGEWQLFEVVG